MRYLSFIRDDIVLDRIEMPEMTCAYAIAIDTMLRGIGLLRENEEVALTEDQT